MAFWPIYLHASRLNTAPKKSLDIASAEYVREELNIASAKSVWEELGIATPGSEGAIPDGPNDAASPAKFSTVTRVPKEVGVVNHPGPTVGFS